MVILRGIPGSGKSTLAQKLGEGGIVLETDEYFMKDGEYKFRIEDVPKADDWNAERARQAAEQGISPIVIDEINIEFWQMKPYVEIAQEYGYEIKFAEPSWTDELKTDEDKWNFDFLKGRNTHGVPDYVVRNMINKFEYNPAIEEILKSKRQLRDYGKPK